MIRIRDHSLLTLEFLQLLPASGKKSYLWIHPRYLMGPDGFWRELGVILLHRITEATGDETAEQKFRVPLKENEEQI